jgi:tetratricopeptide (TPR) repeat protein
MTMLAPLPSVEAFRRDAVSDGVELDDGVAASWLESATRLERAAMTRGAERERFLAGLLAQHGVVTFKDAPLSRSALVSAILGLADEMEDQTFIRLAHSVVSTLLLVVPDSEVLAKGRIVARLARLARHLGDEPTAIAHYKEVERIGTEAREPELVGRALLGYGILAQLRGNFPESRRYLSAVIELPGAANETVAGAHHQLMVAAASAGDFDAAASHGWSAFKESSSTDQETDALLNLAQLLLEAGHARAALRGFAAALARKRIARQELPILGGAACAAAAALPLPADRALVRNFADRLEQVFSVLGEGRRLPWPSASAFVELSEALAVVGDEERSHDFADRAERVASEHGFHQLMHRLENPVHVPSPAKLAESTTEIIAAVDELEGAELVGVAG